MNELNYISAMAIALLMVLLSLCVIGTARKHFKPQKAHYIERKMKKAIFNEEFIPFFQPKYTLENEQITGAEALVRWKPRGEEIRYPDSFIPVFEENGFILSLDFYILDKVCKTLQGYLDEGSEPVAVSVNFSRLHLSNNNFAKELCRVIERYNLPRHLIEITESALAKNEDEYLTVLKTIQKAGFAVALGDFGSGYSTLGFLKDIPANTLKMDKTFLGKTENNSKSNTLIANIIRMAHELGLQTVAEGVENKEQAEKLRAFGCDIVQGYYYARPMTEEAFKKTLQQNSQRIIEIGENRNASCLFT